jgi:diguanylate cyclase (GGDEF)-like protein
MIADKSFPPIPNSTSSTLAFLQNQTLIFLPCLGTLFVSIFMLFLNTPTEYLASTHFLDLLLFWLIGFGLPASLLFSGTGIFIFSLFVFLTLFFVALVLGQTALFFCMPLFVFIEIFVVRHMERFSQKKYRYYLDTEKARETMNDLKESIEQLNQKKNTCALQIERVSNLRNYISDINASLSLSREELSNRILSFISGVIPHGDLYSLALLNPKGRLVTESFIVRESKDNVFLCPEKKDFFNDWVMCYRSPLSVADTLEDYRFQGIERSELLFPKSRSLISSPLISNNKSLGLLRIDKTASQHFQTDDFRLLVVIANLSALFLKNAELFQETQKLSITDGLTGLYLPHYLFKEMNKLTSPEKKQTLFSLLMMDLDFFKKINDTYGHVVGDYVLAQFGALLLQKSPKKSLPVRYGGEEFALLLPEFSKQQAKALAEKIRLTFQEKHIAVRRQQIKVTVSIGIATYPEDSTEPTELVKCADERLYIAKSEGRNKTVAGI